MSDLSLILKRTLNIPETNFLSPSVSTHDKVEALITDAEALASLPARLPSGGVLTVIEADAVEALKDGLNGFLVSEGLADTEEEADALLAGWLAKEKIAD